jgi:hypothetical protein
MSRALAKLPTILVLAGTFCILAVFIRYNARMLPTMPPFGGDDWMSYLAFNLATEGRFGDLMHPINFTNSELRTRDWYYYGHAFTLVGAGLTWLFGESVALQRAIHPIGIVAVATMAFFAFKKISVAAWGLLALLLFIYYFRSHWPQARPDIMVSVFGAAFILAGARAVATDRASWWMLTGLFAGMAATSHFIAGSVVVACALLWVVARLAPHEQLDLPARRHLTSFLSVVTGGVVALLFYLSLANFRITAILTDVLVYPSLVAANNPQKHAGILHHFDLFGRHMHMYWWSTPVPEILFFSGGAMIALILVLWSMLPYFRSSYKLNVLSFLAPPLLTMVCYHALSFTLYPNVFSGYGWFSHVLIIWTACASLAILIYLVGALAARSRRPSLSFMPEAIAAVVIAYALFSTALSSLKAQPYWVSATAGNVSIASYVDHVVEYLPARTRAWGGQIFGSRRSKGIDLLDFYNGPYLIDSFVPEARPALAPDYLLIGSPELRYILQSYIRYRFSPLPRRQRINWSLFSQGFLIPRYLPTVSFELTAIVSAPPYGITRIYRRRTPEYRQEGDGKVQFAINTDGSGHWSRSAGQPLAVQPSAASMTATLNDPTLPDGGKILFNGGRQIELPKGVFLAELSLRDVASGVWGIIVASDVANLAPADFARVSISPYFHSSRKTSLIIQQAKAGPVFIGQLDDNAGAAFDIESVRPIIVVSSRDNEKGFYADLMARCYDNAIGVDKGNCIFDLR